MLPCHAQLQLKEPSATCAEMPSVSHRLVASQSASPARISAMTRAASGSACTAAHHASSRGRSVNTEGQPKCLGRISAGGRGWGGVGAGRRGWGAKGGRKLCRTGGQMSGHPLAQPRTHTRHTHERTPTGTPAARTREEDKGGEERSVPKRDVGARHKRPAVLAALLQHPLQGVQLWVGAVVRW